MAIPQGFIQELIGRVDIVEVVGRHVALKKGGANYMGLCPFHGEKSPSFSVSPTKQFYHCFGCGKNGNAIGFLMDHTGAGFVEVVKDLAQQVGLNVPEEEASAQERARAAEQREKAVGLSDLLEQAGQAYRRQLKDSPRAIEYLKKRGLSGEIAKRFGLGYAPPGWRFLSTVFPDYQNPMLVESGLVIASDAGEGGAGHGEPEREQKRYDRFRDRVMFPIRNVKGQCIGFGGRVLDQGEPKYLNSPETPVFSKGHELYGLFEARTAIRQAGHALVTEGYMDVVALAQLGVEHAVATLGTACTVDHLRLLFRFTDAVVFAFDGDAAGRRAARKALDIALPWASDTRSVKFLFLPAEHDPDSYIRAHGAEAFAQCIQEAVPLSRFLLEAAATGCDLQTAEGRAKMASQAQPMWGALPDGALKRQLLGELASAIGLDSRELHGLWQTHAPSSGRGARRSSNGDGEGTSAHSTGPRASPDAATRRSGRAESYATSTPPAAWTSGGRGHRRTGLLDRADLVARIVLTDPAAWDSLSADDHHLLCEQAAPHGPLFAWLESQWHEHGVQPWAALREGLRGMPFEPWVVPLVEGAIQMERQDPHDSPVQSESPATDKPRELQELLRRMRIDALKRLETETIALAGQDPQAMERYRSLQAQRKALEHGPTPHGNPEPPV